MAMTTDPSQPREVKEIYFDDLRGVRYIELVTVGDKWVTFFNSTGLSDGPDELWEPLDPAVAAERFGVGMVIKNGPHWWAADAMRIKFGTDVIEVGGIGVRWASNISVEIMTGGGLAAGKYYDPAVADKVGELVYRAGRPTYELVRSNGDVYVMQSSNIEIDDFETLGDRLDLPEGWTYRARILDSDLTVTMDGAVQVVMDDLRNVYNLTDQVTA